jgi:hypothetical protein
MVGNFGLGFSGSAAGEAEIVPQIAVKSTFVRAFVMLIHDANAVIGCPDD